MLRQCINCVNISMLTNNTKSVLEDGVRYELCIRNTTSAQICFSSSKTYNLRFSSYKFVNR